MAKSHTRESGKGPHGGVGQSAYRYRIRSTSLVSIEHLSFCIWEARWSRIAKLYIGRLTVKQLTSWKMNRRAATSRFARLEQVVNLVITSGNAITLTNSVSWTTVSIVSDF